MDDRIQNFTSRDVVKLFGKLYLVKVMIDIAALSVHPRVTAWADEQHKKRAAAKR